MAYAINDCCIAANVDPMKVESLAKRLEKLGKEAEKMGLHIFGGSGAGSLRTNECVNDRSIVVAHICAGHWDGGDGHEVEIDGVTYGE